MLQIKTYMLEEINKTPTLEDIKECIEIAKRDSCVVNLIWHMWSSGAYSQYIQADDDPQEYFDKRIPRIYGV